MGHFRHPVSWFVTAMLLLVAMPAWACPYCVGKDKDSIATTLIIVAMVSVPFVIVAVGGLLIRRANQGAVLEAPEHSEVC